MGLCGCWGKWAAGPVAHGTDGAGSVRIPAALCGVFGLKPSYGRVPYYPNADLWGGRSHVGPLARTVRDAAMLLGIMAGPDARDPLSYGEPVPDYLAACDGDLKGLRVVWSADFGYAAVDDEVRRLTEAAAKRFVEFGCIVEEGNHDSLVAAGGLYARLAKLQFETG